MLYAVVPLYGLLNLSVMIFTILFSDKGLRGTAPVTVWEGATLAEEKSHTAVIVLRYL